MRFIINQGGARAGKTLAILQILTIYAMSHANKTILIVGESFPFLLRAVLRDWKDLMGEAFHSLDFNANQMVYRFPTGSEFHFVNGQNPDQFRGVKSNVAFFNEINNIKAETVKEISIRCTEKYFADFNPTAEFYITDFYDDEDVRVIRSTYRDNPFLENVIVEDLLKRSRRDENFRRVYLEGEFGELMGVIFTEGKHWNQVSSMPDVFDKRLFCIDVGYTDPMSINEIRVVNDEAFIRQVMYSTKKTSGDVARSLKASRVSRDTVVVDSAHPMFIEELRRNHGLTVEEAKKPPGSVLAGINTMLQHPMHVTEDSLDIIRDFRSYSWSKDRQTNKFKQVPVHNFSHGPDSVRYGMSSCFSPRSSKQIEMIEI